MTAPSVVPPETVRCDVEFSGSVSRAFCVTHAVWFGRDAIPAACILATWRAASVPSRDAGGADQ